MKYLLLPLAAAAALSGCAYYGDPYYGSYGYPYGTNGAYGPVYPSVGVGVYGSSYGGGHGPARGWRDRDGDGVPNRLDARPRDPRWR